MDPRELKLVSLPDASQIPAELRGLKRWVLFTLVWDDSKQKNKKPPHSPITGEAIGATEKHKDHWVTFDEAIAAARRFSNDPRFPRGVGVGLVFVEADGYVGIDFDDCVVDGKIHPEVERWLRWFPTYKEFSPSLTGVHFICKGRIAKALTATPVPNGGGAKCEMYADGRYFTVTGKRIDDYIELLNCQTSILKLLGALRGNIRETNEANTNQERAMSRLTARKIHSDNLTGLRNAIQGEGNALLNSTAYFAGRAFTAGVLDGTEESIKAELLKVVCEEWQSPHPRAEAVATINSGWGSGVAKPLLILTDDWPEVTQMMEEFNQKYFLVQDFGGHPRVCWEKPNTFGKGKTYTLKSQAVHEWSVFFRDALITTGEDEAGNPRRENKAEVWLRHPRKVKFEEVAFLPNQTTPATIRNLWRGFAFEPRKGNCELYLAHLRDNICQGDPKSYHYLIGWMAHAVRFPNLPGEVAVVIGGLKGIGKNVAAETFGALWGQHHSVYADKVRLTKNFNAHLRDKCLVILDEAFYAADRQHEGILKSLVTGQTLQIEGKGQELIEVPNLLHIIMLSNADWVVPASIDERRFFCLKASAKHCKDYNYFAAIQQQLDAGGYSALLYHLMHEINLNGFNVREAPSTSFLKEQVKNGLHGIHSVWFECLCSGAIPGVSENGKKLWLRASDLIEWAENHERSKRFRGWNELTTESVGALLKNKMKIEKGQAQGKLFHLEDERARAYSIPSLAECRKRWVEAGFPAGDWDDDQNEWETVPVNPLRRVA
jgi:hypothetical protein